MLQKSALFAANASSPSLIAACRVCTWVTWVSVLPFAFLMIALTLSWGSLLIGLIQVGPSFVGLLAQTWAFHRMPGSDGPYV